MAKIRAGQRAQKDPLPDIMGSRSLISVDIDPSKGGFDRTLNPQNRENPYQVQEDELVIADSSERMSSVVGTCAGFYGKGRIKGRDVLVFAHIDADVSDRKLRAKLNKVRDRLRVNQVDLFDSRLDVSPYTSPENARILQEKLEPKTEIPVPKTSEEQVVEMDKKGIKILFRTKTRDTTKNFTGTSPRSISGKSLFELLQKKLP